MKKDAIEEQLDSFLGRIHKTKYPFNVRTPYSDFVKSEVKKYVLNQVSFSWNERQKGTTTATAIAAFFEAGFLDRKVLIVSSKTEFDTIINYIENSYIDGSYDWHPDWRKKIQHVPLSYHRDKFRGFSGASIYFCNCKSLNQIENDFLSESMIIFMKFGNCRVHVVETHESYKEEPKKEKTVDLHQTMDAKVWSKEFVALLKKAGCMTEKDLQELVDGWMANAIMCGYDHANNKRDKQFIYILQSHSGVIVKIFHWEPTEKEMDEAYTNFLKLTDKNQKGVAKTNCSLIRWSKYSEMEYKTGDAEDTKYKWGK